jgi:isopenicillin N synthase-like dioxygenase
VESLPVIDMSSAISGMPSAELADQIDRACREVGFFYVVGHGVPSDLIERLDRAARQFFALDDREKAAIEMTKGGRAWRGWFPLDGELTSGRPDRKEGLYLGQELSPDDARVEAGLPLHGPNLFPVRPAELRAAVLDYIDALTTLGHQLLRAFARALDLTADPLVLFRIFHYPPLPVADDRWSVGQHTDYGLITILAQDRSGGLEVRGPDGWVQAPPIEGSFVVNLGDMLERMTGGAYRSTPHRVRNASGCRGGRGPGGHRPVKRRRRAMGRPEPARLHRHLRRVPVEQGRQGVPRPSRRRARAALSAWTRSTALTCG